MGNVNLVDYDTLEKGKAVYKNQADAIDGVLKAIAVMNDELRFGWTTESAKAFLDSYENVHQKALVSIRQALMDIVKEISDYSMAHKDEDTAHANQMRL